MAGEKWSFSVCQNIMKVTPTERTRRNEEVSVGFTSFAVTVKKILRFYCQGPICNENIFKEGLERKTESVLEENTFPESENAFWAELEEEYSFDK